MSEPNSMSGTVSGAVVQAGTVHGGINIHSPPHVTAIPWQLPPSIGQLSGRAAELGGLSRLLDTERANPLVLCGPGGVGKTTLAIGWASQLRERFPDGQLYAALQGFSGEQPTDPSTILSGFLRGLGLPADQVPVSLAEQTAAYRSMTAGRRMIVLLDDAFSAAQVRPLLGTPPVVTLVTSRRRLVSLVRDGGRLLDVAPMTLDASVELLTQVLGDDRAAREPQHTADLAAICGGLPIALCVVASRLAMRPRMSIRSMLDALADGPTRLATLTVAEPGSAMSVFDASYRSLSPVAAAVYRRLSLHPGPDFGSDVVTALPLDDIWDHPDADAAISDLIEAHLLEEPVEDRFRLHDLLRLDARRRCHADDTEYDRQRTTHAMLEFYLAAAHRADLAVTPYRRRLDHQYLRGPGIRIPEFTDRTAALGWLDRELTNLVAAGRAALDQGHDELAWRLSDVLWPVFLYHKHYQQRLEVDSRGVEAARRWGDRWAEADMLKRLSRVSTKFGRHDEAIRHIHLAVERYREVGDARGVLDAEDGLATLHRDAGRLDLAEQTLVRVLAGYRELGDARTIGLTCLNLGSLRLRSGDPDQALPLLAEARTIFDSLSTVDPYNQVRVLTALAAAQVRSGDLAAAEQSATEAGRRMGDLGSDHERAEALDVLGLVAHRRGDQDTAQRHWSTAAEIFAGLGLVERARQVGRAK
ncbi:tetratricopeptide repeat protein [Micromonospora sp. LOL_021]|uniref:tetratricopeptide repeat protein n=1 Tax=Micromonospora sp. LOL_021 TaxID=3345417 RepID=UPI003A8C4F3A